MLQSLLNRKKMSIYRLSKETKIAYSTLNYLVNGRTPYKNCSVETFYKIARALDVSMDQLYKECDYTIDDFEVFKSNVGHYLKEVGALSFIEYYIIHDDIPKLWDNNRLEALYLIAMVDYLSRIEDIPLCDKFNKYRGYRLQEKVYPASYYAHKKVVPSYELSDVIPEFEHFGIIEGDVFNVT